MRARWGTVLAAVAAGLTLLAPPAAAREAAGEPPAPGGTAGGLLAGATTRDADPPGANDWSCVPGADHPDPVVLVHGFTASKSTNWQTVSPLLADDGYCVFALTYGVPEGAPFPQDQLGGFTRMEESAAELDAFVASVLAATGAERVDLVGHSEGTLMPQYWLQFLGGAAVADDVVAVTPLYDGTLADPLPTKEIAAGFGLREPLSAPVELFCEACPQFVSGSPYLERMNAQPGGAAVPGVTYTTIMTGYDQLVIPHTSGRLDAPNATNIVVQDGCEIDLSDHVSIISTRRTGQLIRNALDPAHASAPPCDVALPAAGNAPLPPG